MTRAVRRVGDMHPNRSLKIVVQPDGDVIVFITQDNMPIYGNEGLGEKKACVEFCHLGGGGRSMHTRKALLTLSEAMEKDNKENPIDLQERQ